MLIALPNAFGDAVTNMAIDAALLEKMPVGLAALRHYAWLEPAVTFGYAQKFEEVRAAVGSELTLCRRLTGGGIVDHRNDWTYALVLHESLPCANLPATELYQKIHAAIQAALHTLELESRLAPCPRECEQPLPSGPGPSQCFVTPAANDVLRPDGTKIAGAAMKRNRNGLLLQGSIDRAALPEDFDFNQLSALLLKAFATALEIERGELEDIRPLFNSEAILREKQRFQSQEWNRKR